MKDEDIEVGCECDYHDINSFDQLNTQNKNNICLLHVNIRSLKKNIEKLSMILADLQVPPQIIALSETKINKKQSVNFSTTLKGYNFLHSDSDTLAGGVGIYINNSLSYQLRNDIPTSHQYGFRMGLSTTLAIYDMQENILENLEKGFITCTIFCVLSKAFDTTDHDVLLWKLANFFGIRGLPLRLLD